MNPRQYPGNLYKHTRKERQIYSGNTFPKREYYNWISEETDMPISFLIKMSKMFKTTTDYLLEGAAGIHKEPREDKNNTTREGD